MITPDNTPYTITQLNTAAKQLLESALGTVSVMGEISNLARPSSGHLYFTLKDDTAQVRCALFRGSRRRIDFDIENGQAVIAQATVSLYTGRGDYQLIVSDLHLAGSGALQLAFDKLKAKLLSEGLFDETRKQPIPAFPTQIGVITSSTGAALRDILKVLQRRCPMIPVMVYPSLVQGTQAADAIVQALRRANQEAKSDVLILARGGGSLEDLWPFNEERVARAIAESRIPIVTGVGHETDFTIADFVADYRAATPSAAAETVSPDQQALLNTLTQYQERLTQWIQRYLAQCQQQLLHYQKRLRHPKEILAMQAQRLDQYEQRLSQAMKHQVQYQQEVLKGLSQALHAISPLATLERGYTILTRTTDHSLVRHAKNVKIGETLQAQLTDGTLTLKVS